ncbi:MAG: hypothetical protein JRJ64_11555 [Deltaproteobacteria bacterium]|nr:hypothetical protein [Deltaproteobacteria bacterium]
MKRRDATGVSEILEEDEVSAVLRDTFYGGKSGKRSRAKPKKPKQTKPDHYDVICISLYKEDLAQLDKMVAKTRRQFLGSLGGSGD